MLELGRRARQKKLERPWRALVSQGGHEPVPATRAGAAGARAGRVRLGGFFYEGGEAPPHLSGAPARRPSGRRCRGEPTRGGSGLTSGADGLRFAAVVGWWRLRALAGDPPRAVCGCEASCLARQRRAPTVTRRRAHSPTITKPGATRCRLLWRVTPALLHASATQADETAVTRQTALHRIEL